MHHLTQRHMLIFSLLTAVLLVTGSGQAQDQTQDQAKTKPGNRAGFFVGVNFASQGGDMEMMGEILASELELEIGGIWSSSKGTIPGLGLGGFYTVQTSPTFGVQIEGQYIRRGGKIDLTGRNVPGGLVSVTLETEFQLDYLEFPILARFSPSPEAKFRLLFLAGPVIGFKTGANLEISTMGQSESESISEGYASVTVGLLGGFGFSAQVGQTSFLTIQARYYRGLTNPLDDDILEAKSGDFGLFAGMEFLLN